MNFFSKDFYPTPDHVIEMMGIDCQGKVVLEPSAGKGNIVEWLEENGAAQVIACEKNVDLAEIVKTKARFLKHDFLAVRAEEISHVNLIVMNPPFSADETHILHAWEIAPPGCEIIALCNWETLDVCYSRERRQLKRTIEDNGNSEFLGDVFTDAERKTGVEIGLVRLFKQSAGSNEFDGFFMDEEDEQPQENGIMRFDAIRDVVQRYVFAVKCFDEHEIVNEKMKDLCAPFGVGGFSISVGRKEEIFDRESFKKELQKKAWQHLFSLMNLNKYLTTGVMKDINAFVEKQTNVPFTMRNIYKMFEIIVGTKEQIFDRALVEAIDKFTEYTHENRFHVEGWKTNSGHMLNEKFIVNYMVESTFAGKGLLRVKYSGNCEKVEDLVKVLCSLTATDYNTVTTLHAFTSKVFKDGIEPNRWYEWGFFEIKCFKKGTMHFKFTDRKVWETLNRRYAKIKGQVLPEKFRI